MQSAVSTKPDSEAYKICAAFAKEVLDDKSPWDVFIGDKGRSDSYYADKGYVRITDGDGKGQSDKDGNPIFKIKR